MKIKKKNILILAWMVGIIYKNFNKFGIIAVTFYLIENFRLQCDTFDIEFKDKNPSKKLKLFQSVTRDFCPSPIWS